MGEGRIRGGRKGEGWRGEVKNERRSGEGQCSRAAVRWIGAVMIKLTLVYFVLPRDC